MNKIRLTQILGAVAALGGIVTTIIIFIQFPVNVGGYWDATGGGYNGCVLIRQSWPNTSVVGALNRNDLDQVNLTGKVSDNRLQFHYKSAGGAGTGTLILLEDGSLRGTWQGVRANASMERGDWILRPRSEPC